MFIRKKVWQDLNKKLTGCEQDKDILLQETFEMSTQITDMNLTIEEKNNIIKSKDKTIKDLEYNIEKYSEQIAEMKTKLESANKELAQVSTQLSDSRLYTHDTDRILERNKILEDQVNTMRGIIAKFEKEKKHRSYIARKAAYARHGMEMPEELKKED